MENNFFVISGLSGAGKTTILYALLKKLPNLKRLITCTTRSPREGEQNGIDYKFVSKEDFESWIENNELIEYANVYGNYYGSLKNDLNELLKTNNLIVSVDVQGVVAFKKSFPKAKTIFIDVPLEEIEKRLRGRGTDEEEVIKKRLAIAKEELAYKDKFDFIVENIDLEKAINDVKEIILSEK